MFSIVLSYKEEFLCVRWYVRKATLLYTYQLATHSTH